MKRILLILSIPFLVFSTHGVVQIEDSAVGRNTILKVLTHTDLEGALIEVKGSFVVKDPSSGRKIDASFFKKRCYLTSTSDGLKWGSLYKNTHQIEITPKDKNTTFLINGIQYNGKVSAYDISSQIFIVVELDVDEYLKSVLSANFSYKPMHQTTLEALAISMRTDLYHKIATSTNPFWDIKATDHNFLGTSLKTLNSGADSAVTATHDLILLYKNRPFPTTWSEDCGGRTAQYKMIFRKDVPSPNGVFVSYAQKLRNKNKWKCSLSKRELAKLLDLESIQSIEPFKDSTTEKIYGLRFNGRNLSFRELTIQEFQNMIGIDRIQSNDFNIKLIDRRIEFTGHGKGLGVGICLMSAKDMAKSGKATSKILSAFYPETKIMKLEFVPQVFFNDGEIE
jgi:SpoIID/LytB domain protein